MPLIVRDRRRGSKISAFPEVRGYEILGIPGRSGRGVVYKARQVALNRLVALKMILSGGYAEPQQIARFHAEAPAVARVKHPHIAQIYEIGEYQGQRYLTKDQMVADQERGRARTEKQSGRSEASGRRSQRRGSVA